LGGRGVDGHGFETITKKLMSAAIAGCGGTGSCLQGKQHGVRSLNPSPQ